jgi:hypothetical protein
MCSSSLRCVAADAVGYLFRRSGNNARWENPASSAELGGGSRETTRVRSAKLEFSDNRGKLYTSEDKHVNYPSEEVGESVRLVWLGNSLGDLVLSLSGPGEGLSSLGAFVQEDVGGGPTKRWPCYNAGEPGNIGQPGDDPSVRLIDDIGVLFKNELTDHATQP